MPNALQRDEFAADAAQKTRHRLRHPPPGTQTSRSHPYRICPLPRHRARQRARARPAPRPRRPGPRPRRRARRPHPRRRHALTKPRLVRVPALRRNPRVALPRPRAAQPTRRRPRSRQPRSSRPRPRTHPRCHKLAHPLAIRSGRRRPPHPRVPPPAAPPARAPLTNRRSRPPRRHRHAQQAHRRKTPDRPQAPRALGMWKDGEFRLTVKLYFCCAKFIECRTIESKKFPAENVIFLKGAYGCAVQSFLHLSRFACPSNNHCIVRSELKCTCWLDHWVCVPSHPFSQHRRGEHT